jgi:hypothetical protein
MYCAGIAVVRRQGGNVMAATAMAVKAGMASRRGFRSSGSVAVLLLHLERGEAGNAADVTVK